MRIAEMNWMQVEAYLKREDRAVLPIGSTEQHGYLSLCTDNLLCERVAIEAAEPLGVAVFPVLNYGVTPYFKAFPGSVSLRVETLVHVVRDVLDSLAHSGFRRILIVNGHGGNTPAQALTGEWAVDNPGCKVRFHSWWNAPLTWAKVMQTDNVASHASWMENFPWTRLANVELPKEQKSSVDVSAARLGGPQALRAALRDGNYGGYYQLPDEQILEVWKVGVAETRAQLTDPWG